MKLILLTVRYHGLGEVEHLNEGVFSSLEKAKEAVLKSHGGTIVKEEGNYFKTSKGLGSAFDNEYDWTEVELDKIILSN